MIAHARTPARERLGITYTVVDDRYRGVWQRERANGSHRQLQPASRPAGVKRVRVEHTLLLHLPRTWPHLASHFRVSFDGSFAYGNETRGDVRADVREKFLRVTLCTHLQCRPLVPLVPLGRERKKIYLSHEKVELVEVHADPTPIHVLRPSGRGVNQHF